MFGKKRCALCKEKAKKVNLKYEIIDNCYSLEPIKLYYHYSCLKAVICASDNIPVQNSDLFYTAMLIYKERNRREKVEKEYQQKVKKLLEEAKAELCGD